VTKLAFASAPCALATTAINAAIAEAKKHDWKLNVAVVDSGGNLVAFQRMDGAQLASIPISEHKARAAVNFRRETKVGRHRLAGRSGVQSRRRGCAEIARPNLHA